jgi:hypothetical protein
VSPTWNLLPSIESTSEEFALLFLELSAEDEVLFEDEPAELLDLFEPAEEFAPELAVLPFVELELAASEPWLELPFAELFEELFASLSAELLSEPSFTTEPFSSVTGTILVTI